MTIREFSRLCLCHPQTLRYYDRVGLLKPVRVDKWSGYRFYDEAQALTFVKIKNLQTAGFTIEEIKGLLDADNDMICAAFSEKIKEQEARLQKMREIRRSYQSEMTQMKEKLEAMRDRIRASMAAYDPTEEFGISRETYDRLIDGVSGFFEGVLERESDGDFAYTDYPDGDAVEEADFLELLNNPAYEVVYEKHGWQNVKEFLDELAALEDGWEYVLYFRLTDEKCGGLAFANTMLGILLDRSSGRKRSLGCNVEPTEDGKNHFWLMKRKQ